MVENKNTILQEQFTPTEFLAERENTQSNSVQSRTKHAPSSAQKKHVCARCAARQCTRCFARHSVKLSTRTESQNTHKAKQLKPRHTHTHKANTHTQSQRTHTKPTHTHTHKANTDTHKANTHKTHTRTKPRHTHTHVNTTPQLPREYGAKHVKKWLQIKVG